MTDKKIFIGTCTYKGKDYCFKEFMNGFLDSSIPENVEVDFHIVDNTIGGNEYFRELGKRLKDFPNITVYRLEFPNWETKQRVVASSQNFLRQIFLNDKLKTHFQSLESDVILNKNDIKNLIEADKPVIAGVVPYNDHNSMIYKNLSWSEKDVGASFTAIPFMRSGNGGTLEGKFQLYHSSGWNTIRTEYHMVEIMGDNFPDIRQVAGASLGCTLIERSVLEKIRFRIRPDVDCKDFSDIFFYIDCIRKKIPVFVHKKVRPKHMWKSWAKTAKGE